MPHPSAFPCGSSVVSGFDVPHEATQSGREPEDGGVLPKNRQPTHNKNTDHSYLHYAFRTTPHLFRDVENPERRLSVFQYCMSGTPRITRDPADACPGFIRLAGQRLECFRSRATTFLLRNPRPFLLQPRKLHIRPPRVFFGEGHTTCFQALSAATIWGVD